MPARSRAPSSSPSTASATSLHPAGRRLRSRRIRSGMRLRRPGGLVPGRRVGRRARRPRRADPGRACTRPTRSTIPTLAHLWQMFVRREHSGHRHRHHAARRGARRGARARLHGVPPLHAGRGSSAPAASTSARAGSVGDALPRGGASGAWSWSSTGARSCRPFTRFQQADLRALPEEGPCPTRSCWSRAPCA